jgi:hypothetical protein
MALLLQTLIQSSHGAPAGTTTFFFLRGSMRRDAKTTGRHRCAAALCGADGVAWWDRSVGRRLRVVSSLCVCRTRSHPSPRFRQNGRVWAYAHTAPIRRPQQLLLLLMMMMRHARALVHTPRTPRVQPPIEFVNFRGLLSVCKSSMCVKFLKWLLRFKSIKEIHINKT